MKAQLVLRLIAMLGLLAIGCSAPAAPAQPAAAPGGTSGGAAAPASAQTPAGASAAAPASAGAPAPVAPPARARPRVAYTAISGSTWPVWIAQDTGIFAKHGLDADIEFVASSTTAMQSMLSGEVAFVPTASAPTVIQAVLGGADAVIIGATNNTVIFSLMSAPSIRQYADLRGKRIGISRLGASTDSAARSALLKWGLKPDEEVTILQMGGVPEALAGLTAGAIDAAVLSTPHDLRAKQAGFNELADLGAIGIDYPQTAIATTRGYLAANEDVARRFLRATVEAVHVMKSDPATAQAIFGKYTDSDDPEILQASYRAYVDKTESVPYAKPAAMQVAIAEVAQTDPRAASAKPEDFADNRYVQELETSGFIQQLGSR
jgi:NitT/TauT family transport system substrate-binding protein